MTAETFTIPGGYDFAEQIKIGSQSSAFFAWLAHNRVDPARINPAADVVIKTADGTSTWLITAVTTDGVPGTWPLDAPAAPVVEWLREEFGVKTAALDAVADKIARLEKARADAKAANDTAEELRAEVLGILSAQRATVGTVNGQPVIQAKPFKMPGRLNRSALEAEYPEIVERFTGEPYTQTRLEFI